MNLLALLLLVPSLASAVPAGRSGQLEATVTPTGLALSADERFVLLTHAGAGGVTVFDRTSFLAGGASLSVCSNALSVVFISGVAIEDRFYVGCTGGEVYRLTPDLAAFPATWLVSAPTTLSADITAGDVVALDFAGPDTVVHAVLQNDGYFSHWSIALADDSAVRVAPTNPGQGTITYAAVGEDGSPWVLADSAGQFRSITRLGDSYTVGGTSGPYNRIVGIAVSNALDTLFVADAEQSEVWTVPASDPLLPGTEHPGVFTAPVAFALGGPYAAPILWVGESGGDLVGADHSGVELFRANLDGQDAAYIAPVEGVDGAVYVAGTGGAVRIVSDRPFISALAADATTLAPGDSFTLTFVVDEAASYDIRVGGGLPADSGTSLATGAAEAGAEVSVTLSADDLINEGDNRAFVFADSGSGEVGSESIVLTFDGPPGALGTPNLGAADQRLELGWTATADPDIAAFQVFVSDASFDASSLPSFVATDGSAWPQDVLAGTPSTDQGVTVMGLENGATYYLALRAVDAGGQVGPLSDVVSGSPQSTCGAAECAGEPVGCSSCTSLAAGDPTAPRLLGLLLLLGAWLLRRR